jgi:para-nitrobenzyl esterase
VLGQDDADGTWVWKAIPFARPPLGQLRWRAPQDPVPWQGVRRETAFNAGCTQFSEVIPGMISGSEDCLYLNVWRPRDAEPGLPVYVWIHGGGNSTGSATHISTYLGNRIASRSRVVFVSVNYRLGPFGWFTLPALREGVSPEDASGNYGTLDLIQSLKWIRDNIEAFGGDPARVTITGESAGGIDVLSLLISPPARGLF